MKGFKNIKNREKGFLETIIIIVVALAILLYFGISPTEVWNDWIEPFIRTLSYYVGKVIELFK